MWAPFTKHFWAVVPVSPALDFRVEVAEVSRDAQFIQQASVCLCAAEGTASVLTSSMAELEQLRARMGHNMLLQQQVTYSLHIGDNCLFLIWCYCT